MDRVNEIDRIVLEELGSKITKEQLVEIGIESVESVISEDKLEIYRERFAEMSVDELDEVLSLTIKNDRIVKVITFLGMLTAYTEDSQTNISFNAPTSTGKSYIPLEISKLFPKEDVIEVSYCSPTGFFHDRGEYDKVRGIKRIDLSRKVLIFIDQPHSEVLQRLRPLLSHDRKILLFKITDKNRKGQNKTQNIEVIGFPSVVFCTAGLKMNEQETTRVLLLSPEITQEKLTSSIQQIIKKQENKDFSDVIESNVKRQFLKERILTIKGLKFKDVVVAGSYLISDYYSQKELLPGDQRNIVKLYSIIKGLALLNFAHREVKDRYVIANEEDIKTGIYLWKEIAKYQELGIPPFIYWFYEQVFLPVYKKKKDGIKKKDLFSYHSRVFSKVLTEKRLRIEILPQLVNCGLIREEKDPEDKREKVYFPVGEECDDNI
jgi:hypothetical protein